MAKFDEKAIVTLSVFDRLIDLDPKSSSEPPSSRSVSIQALKQAVRRDLEWLLNTRSHAPDGISESAEMRRSVAFYGLPDILGMSPKNPAEQKRLTAALEAAIRNFEPRFLDPKVVLEPVNAADRQLRFRIEATLDVEPTPEPVVFDTILQTGSGEFGVTSR